MQKDVTKIPALGKTCVRVIVETPKGSCSKYSFDQEFGVMKPGQQLPEGFFFPFDFGFIPQTMGEDNDPLDAIILMDVPSISGALIECRLLGAITGHQKDNGARIRNDRFLFTPADIEKYGSWKSI